MITFSASDTCQILPGDPPAYSSCLQQPNKVKPCCIQGSNGDFNLECQPNCAACQDGIRLVQLIGSESCIVTVFESNIIGCFSSSSDDCCAAAPVGVYSAGKVCRKQVNGPDSIFECVDPNVDECEPK